MTTTTWLAGLATVTLALAVAASCSSESSDDNRGTGGNSSSSSSSSSGTGAEGGFHAGGAGGGGDGGSCATASDQVVASPVDVIFAIDQSASMGEEIQGVIDNLNTNLTSILAGANIDYRVVFVAGVSNLPSGPEYFTSAAAVNSSDALTLLLWTYDGFYKAPNTCDQIDSPALRWKDFLRYDSQKVFIIVSDDDPSSFDCAYAAGTCSAPNDCSGCANSCAGWCPMHQCPTYAEQAAAWGGEGFPSELYKLDPVGMFGTVERPKWMLHGIIAVDAEYGPADPITPLGQVCNVNGNTGETSGVEYQKLAVMSGGMRFPSCNTDYSPVFQTIAQTIVPLACKFSLEQTSVEDPDPATTNVVIDYGDGNGEQTIPKDDSAPCDGGANGWQFADGGLSVVLCGEACDKLKNSTDPSVSITQGCATVIR